MVLEGLNKRAVALSRFSKRRIAMVVDASLCAVTVYCGIYLRIGTVPQQGPQMWALVLASVAIAIPMFRIFGLYREIFSESGFRSVVDIGRACALYGLAFSAIFTFTGFAGIPRTVGIIQPILLFLLVSASRVFARYWLGVSSLARPREEARRALVFGAGSAGRQVAAALVNSREMRVVGFIDDDPALHGSVINGTPIFASEDIVQLAERLAVTDVLLAIPSASQRRRTEVLSQMREARLHVRTLPGITDLAHGRVTVADIRELDVGDLLGRAQVAPDPALMSRLIHGKTVLVTGAGGSIGSELCRQALATGPKRLLLLENSEYALYTIHGELAGRRSPLDAGSVEIIPLLGSVLDEMRVRDIIATWNPDTIYHAAAYKHVPLVEHNPAEGVRNNVFGTRTVAQVAGEWRVPNVVLISTDKAVRPTNVMGATKRGAELVLQALNEEFADTCFSMVRFGNVLGSSGSVVPLFRQQIRDGGPVTITDVRITRYFMTIPEAAQLVIQAGAMATGGEVFVLDMGEPVQIVDLARTMIELSGRKVRDVANPDGDIEIEEVGLRPGEKLYEELLIGENPQPTPHPRILKANEGRLPLDTLEAYLRDLQHEIDAGSAPGIIRLMERLVPEFKCQDGVVDWVHVETSDRALREPPATAA